MREILELQTGQVAFLSGLMAGFAISVAAQVLRHGIRRTVNQMVFLALLATTLLFLVALYVDVRLTIELAGVDVVPDSLAASIQQVRSIGTSSATVALVLFIVSIGMLGWIASVRLGLVSSAFAGAVLLLLFVLWKKINTISPVLAGLAQ